jgi:multidrug resistance efflux pump
VELDSREEQATLEEARRRVRQMEVDLERRKGEMEVDLERRRVALSEQKRNHGDAIAIARLQLKNAETKLARSEELVEKGLKAGSALEDDRLREELARAELASLLARDLGIYEQLLARDRATYDRELAVMEQELQARSDAVVKAETRVRAKEIRAPISGQVLRYEFVIGELVRPETVLYEIFGGEDQVLRLQVAERYATKVAVGQRYSAVLPGVSHRGLRTVYFTGTVQNLRNVIQAEGKRTYRVAYCDFDAQEYRIPPGTTAEARIYYGRSSLLYYLFNIDP